MNMMNEPSIEGAAMFFRQASQPGSQTLRIWNSTQKGRRIVVALIVRNLVTPRRLSSSYMERRRFSFGRSKRPTL